MKEFRNPSDVHQPLGSYSHQMEVSGNERLLVISGQVGMREDGSVPDDPFEQIDLAFENIFQIPTRRELLKVPAVLEANSIGYFLPGKLAYHYQYTGAGKHHWVELCPDRLILRRPSIRPAIFSHSPT